MYKKMLGLLLGAVVSSGCASLYPTPPDAEHLDDFPLPRFDRVDSGVYRSAQPSGDQLRKLMTQYGIRTVLKLNTGVDAAPTGVTVLSHPLSVMKEPTVKELEAILEAIENSPKPVLIHCTHGEDRTGLIVALYRMRRGTTTETAYADMVRHGFHPYPGVWRAWLRSSGWSRYD